MSTTQMAAALFQLQQLDLELERLVAENQALSNSLQKNPTVKKLQGEYALAQQELASGQQAQKEAEWALEELDQRLRLQEQRLYGGMVANPKELHALQQEVQRLRAQKSRQEEMTLEIMEATEALRSMVEQKGEALGRAEEAWKQANSLSLARQQQIEARQEELRKKRGQYVTALDGELLKRYDVLRKTKQGRAVSKVEQNSCQWCRVILTASELQYARVSVELQMCSNCGRILYYDR